MTDQTDYNPLRDLAATGAHAVLARAATVIRTRGWTCGVTCSRAGVDILGAVAIGAGAKIGAIDDRPDLLETVVPERNRLAALAAWHVLECAIDDPVAWNDEPGRRATDVIDLLEQAACRLAVAQ